MRFFFKIILLSLLPAFCNAQQNKLDSLRNELAKATNDSTRYLAGRDIYDHYEETNRDSAFYYANECLLLARKNNKKLAEVHALDNKAYQLIGLGRYAAALQNLFEAFNIAGDPALDKEKTWKLFSTAFNKSFTGQNRLLMLCYTHHIMGILMWQTDNSEQTIFHFKEARTIASSISHDIRQMMADMNLGRSYMMTNRLDSAFLLENEAVQLAFKTGFKKYLGQVYGVIGAIYQRKNDKQQEKRYYYMSEQTAKEENNLINLSSAFFLLTKYYITQAEKDSAIYYSMKNLEVIRQTGNVTGLSVNLGTVYENIYLAYKLGDQQDSIFKYQGLTLTVKDSFFTNRIKNLTEFQNLTFKEQLRLQELAKEKRLYQSRVRMYTLLGGLGVFLLIALLLYRNTRQQRKTNKALETTLSNLKSTQSQLVQSEKMASLGELTAGIAHEIQNPLNFVNNFSEVNKELLAEMNEEIEKGNFDEVKLIAKDVADNEEKINQHGKRADAIVKGMLQHSRSSSGQKEPTNINVLADEYLRLAYHGLRAKDKSFNATLKTDYDESIGNINIIPQDIGRVILNLITNAFYVVDEKKKNLRSPEGGVPYDPTISVSTKKIGGKVEIKVADNGNGIPQKVLDKIFQPFFTTKPTGQGTGLGLSLSYDIVKAHGGELKVETKEGEGATFIIILSI